ncbi:unnamed protein product, partial [Brassica oleracea var. botrytis]
KNQREEKSREKKRGGGEKKDLERLRSSPEFVIASAPRDKVELATTVNRRPSSCSSRQDEAVDTNHASIGARTKLHTPPKDSPRRARETHAPPPSAATPPPDHRPPPQLRRRRRPTFRFGVHLSSWSSYIPLLFIAKVRPTSRSDYTGPVLLGFYYYWAFGLLSFYRFYRY